MSDEYWIQETGDVDFADGDVGDRNHEAIVIDQVQRMIVTRCEDVFDVRKKNWHGMGNFSDDEYVDWDEFKKVLATAYGEEYLKTNPSKQRLIKAYLQNDPDKLSYMAFKQAGVKKTELDCAEGHIGAREYAMQYWGWKTYRNGHVDTWRIARSDLQAIISGIESIADDSGWPDKKLNRASFTINVFSNNKHFSLSYLQMKKWLETPNAPLPPMPDQDWRYNTSQFNSAMSKSNRDWEIGRMNPVYKRPGVNPMGDSVMSFKAFIENNKISE